MRKLVFALILLACFCWSGSASAQLAIAVTPSGTSGCPPGHAALCPCGSMDWFQVQVWEMPPSPGSIITVAINRVPGLCICPGQSPLSAVEGPSGNVSFTFNHLGGCLNVTFTASTTTPGVAPVTSTPVLMISPDLNGDCIVNLVDFGIFALNYLTTAVCCDYNCDGTVNLIDFAIFAQHFLHWC
jgi:hypothetical protein